MECPYKSKERKTRGAHRIYSALFDVLKDAAAASEVHIAVNWGVGIETPQHQKHHFPLQCDTDAAQLASRSETGDARVIEWKD